MEEAARKLADILVHAEKIGLPDATLCNLRGVRKLTRRQSSNKNTVHFVAGVVSVTLALIYSLGLYTHTGFSRTWLKWHQLDLYTELCTITMPEILVKAFRPPEDCSMCHDVTEVERVNKITPWEFEERYAYTGRPVIVVDAMENWTAQHVFTFDFFKELYKDSYGQDACQFFPYQTEFRSLREVFNMSEERAHMRDGTKPWYIGWSNCDDHAARTLREHYSRPYFLPETAENKKVDWIFMGSPGYGAKMHVDSVTHPSWQAQLKGQKKWILEPPPECQYECKGLETTVRPEEIIVLDTNRWYHQTLIISHDMSITIGAEFD